ncbi:MAG TPA: DNA polymerase IV [Thermoplasmata archaeon]|nr:DNA polymerase IV [Thermoplasmata archaeon]
MRWVVYVDMDAYYVSAELRDRPELRGTAVIVGHKPQGGPSRGVVLSASYEARALGVHSAMPSLAALRKAPDATWIPPDFGKYERTAREIRQLLGRWADRVVPLSIDEAALEVDLEGRDEVEAWARDIQSALSAELHLPASIGASPYSVVAKIACDAAKPGGVRVVPAEGTREFLSPLAVGAIPGIGPKTSERLLRIEVRTIEDLARASVGSLRTILGSYADSLRALAMGRPVPELATLPQDSGPRQRSMDRTFEQDTRDESEILRRVEQMATELAEGLRSEGLHYQNVVVRIRWEDFTQIQRGRQLPAAHEGAEALVRESVRLARELLERERSQRDRAVRRLSVSAGELTARRGRQPALEEFVTPSGTDK